MKAGRCWSASWVLAWPMQAARAASADAKPALIFVPDRSSMVCLRLCAAVGVCTRARVAGPAGASRTPSQEPKLSIRALLLLRIDESKHHSGQSIRGKKGSCGRAASVFIVNRTPFPVIRYSEQLKGRTTQLPAPAMADYDAMFGVGKDSDDDEQSAEEMDAATAGGDSEPRNDSGCGSTHGIGCAVIRALWIFVLIRCTAPSSIVQPVATSPPPAKL